MLPYSPTPGVEADCVGQFLSRGGRQHGSRLRGSRLREVGLGAGQRHALLQEVHEVSRAVPRLEVFQFRPDPSPLGQDLFHLCLGSNVHSDSTAGVRKDLPVVHDLRHRHRVLVGPQFPPEGPPRVRDRGARVDGDESTVDAGRSGSVEPHGFVVDLRHADLLARVERVVEQHLVHAREDRLEHRPPQSRNLAVLEPLPANEPHECSADGMGEFPRPRPVGIRLRLGQDDLLLLVGVVHEVAPGCLASRHRLSLRSRGHAPEAFGHLVDVLDVERLQPAKDCTDMRSVDGGGRGFEELGLLQPKLKLLQVGLALAGHLVSCSLNKSISCLA